jgi:hypothetical protein
MFSSPEHPNGAQKPEHKVPADIGVDEPRTACQLLLQWAGPIDVPLGMLHRRETQFARIATVREYDDLIASHPVSCDIINGYILTHCNQAIREAMTEQK